MQRTVVLFVFLVLLSVWESAAALLGRRGAPTEADWLAVERFVRQEYKPGDLITFAPRWIDPIGRAHLGDLIPLGAATRADGDGHARVWSVSFHGARPPEIKDRVEVKVQRGALVVGLHTATPPEVGYDFLANLSSEGVGAAVGAQAKIAEVDFEPHRCIYLTPGTAPKSIVFPAVRLGRGIVGYTGLDHFHQRKLGKGLVEMAVYVGDQLKERIIHSNDSGWRRFEIDTSGSAGTTKSVRFEVSAPDPRHRLFCFTAEARI